MSKRQIRKMLRKIEEDGWKRGSLGTKDGPVCLVGAANYAATGDPTDGSGDDIKVEYLNTLKEIAMKIDPQLVKRRLKYISPRNHSEAVLQDKILGMDNNFSQLARNYDTAIIHWNDRTTTKSEVVNLLKSFLEPVDG